MDKSVIKRLGGRGGGGPTLKGKSHENYHFLEPSLRMIALLPSFKTNVFCSQVICLLLLGILLPLLFLPLLFPWQLHSFLWHSDITLVSVTLHSFQWHYIHFCDRSVYSPQVPGDPLLFAAPISTNHTYLYKWHSVSAYKYNYKLLAKWFYHLFSIMVAISLFTKQLKIG